MRSIFLIFLVAFFGCNSQPASWNFSIKDFGAIGDGKTLNTSAIQQAIDQAASLGGGTVYFPPGKYKSGTIELKSDVSLQFESGASLIGSERLEDYTGERKSFIIGDSLENISIAGKGIIDGNGHTFWDEDYQALERPEPWIFLLSCKNVSIEGIKLINSPSHVLRLEASEDVTVNDISIINDFRGPNTDGIDIVDSKNVRISNSFISTGDDAICLKTHRLPVENIVVTNCILESDDAAIKFGTGSRAATRFCTFSNITIRRTRYGISFFMLDGGVYEHNLFSNIIIKGGSRHRHEYPIFIDIDKRVEDRNYGRINNNTFSNIKIVSSGKVLVSGHPESKIEGIDFRNISFHLTEDQDFTESNKPRGNKRYPKLSTSVDLSREPAVFVFGYIKDLSLSDVSISYPSSSNRKGIFTREVETFRNDGLREIKN